MNQNDLKIILYNLYIKNLSPEDAFKQLQNISYENLGFAKIDHHRELRLSLIHI